MKLGHKVLLILLILALPAAHLTFEDMNITVDVDAPEVYVIRKTWWGLKQQRIPIRWMKATGYDFEAWCAQTKSGEWYPYLVEPEDGPDDSTY